MWYRIFSAETVEPPPGAMLAHLNRLAAVRGEFHGDDTGWFHADLQCCDIPLSLDRYTAEEEGIRAELNSWAAFVESRDDKGQQARLMERIIQTRQLFVLQSDCHSPCLALCQYLALATNGVYQIDGEGFFAADGTILLRET